MQLESVLQYVDRYLSVPEHPDYPNALNGLQVAGPQEVSHIVAAVDASEASITEAVTRGAQLMIVHHGLFWQGLQPLTGPHLRRVQALLDNQIALYSCHLPLDSHAEVGNSALLGRALGLEPEGRFAGYGGVQIGWHGRFAEALDAAELVSRAEDVLGGPIHSILGGPDRIETVGVVTGGGASAVAESVGLGLDAFVTGEGTHHTHFDAMELGIHVLFGGHYATETFGVRALAEHLAHRFGLTWDFVDQPTGL